MRTFAARYEGTCPACLEPIHVGDMVTYKTDALRRERVVHERCAKRILICDRDSFVRAAGKRDLAMLSQVVLNALDRAAGAVGSDPAYPVLRQILTSQGEVDTTVGSSPLAGAVDSLQNMLLVAQRGRMEGAAGFAYEVIEWVADLAGRTNPGLHREIMNGAYTDLQRMITAALKA